MNYNYYEKYLKYKNKYLSLKTGGGWNQNSPIRYLPHTAIPVEFEDDCPICFDPISNGNKVIKLFSPGPSSCGHVVHENCFILYLQSLPAYPIYPQTQNDRIPKCPVCRAHVNRYYEINGNNTWWSTVYRDEVFSRQPRTEEELQRKAERLAEYERQQQEERARIERMRLEHPIPPLQRQNAVVVEPVIPNNEETDQIRRRYFIKSLH
jgi:hypothetical protein